MVICLSTTVRNDTLQDAKEQRVSLKCRKQLRVEELEMVAHAPPMDSATVSLAWLAAEILNKLEATCAGASQVAVIGWRTWMVLVDQHSSRISEKPELLNSTMLD